MLALSGHRRRRRRCARGEPYLRARQTPSAILGLVQPASVSSTARARSAEQWLAANGDGRDPAQARSADATGSSGVAALPGGEWFSIARAEVFVSALAAPPGCRVKFVLDERALARLGYSY